MGAKIYLHAYQSFVDPRIIKTSMNKEHIFLKNQHGYNHRLQEIWDVDDEYNMKDKKTLIKVM